MTNPHAPRRGILPTSRRKPRTRMSEYSHMIFAEAGFGKTTWANSWRNAIFAACEPGTAALEAADVQIRSWEDFLAFLDAIEREPHAWETVVVDTVDMLHHYCRASVCRDLGIGHPSEAAYAKGWDLLKDRWVGVVNRAARLKTTEGRQICTLFIAHQKTTPLTESRDGKAVDTGRSLVTTNLPTSARGVLHSALDFLYHGEFASEDVPEVGISRGDRVIRTQPSSLPHAHIEAKGRGSLGRKLPDLLPLDFPALSRAFNMTFNGGTNDGR